MILADDQFIQLFLVIILLMKCPHWTPTLYAVCSAMPLCLYICPLAVLTPRHCLGFCITAMADDTGNWGHQTWGEVRQTVGDVWGFVFQNSSILTSIHRSIQMLSEYDIHVYSFCGQAIQSLVDCVLIRFITISISQCHTLGPLVSILGSQCLQPPRYRSSYVWV